MLLQNRGTEWARSVFQERRRASRFALISAPCACFFLKALPSLFFFSSRPSLASLPFHFCFSLSLSRLRLSASRSPASSSLSHQPPQQKHLDTTPMNSFIYHHQHSTSPKKKLKTGNQKKKCPRRAPAEATAPAPPRATTPGSPGSTATAFTLWPSSASCWSAI